MGLKVCQLCAVDFTLKHFLLPLIDGMREKGWEVIAVCSNGPFVENLCNQGYRIETVKISRSINPVSALISLISLVILFKRERFDVLHVHTPIAALIGRLAAWFVRIPLVVYTAHGFYFHDNMPNWQYRFFVILERAAGLLTDLLFTQSMEDARTTITEQIMPASRVLAIGNGVDVIRFKPQGDRLAHLIRQSLGIPLDAHVVGFIGRLVMEKGICEFLQASESIARYHSNTWFLVIGERLASDHAAGVNDALLRTRGILGDRLITTGLRSDIPNLLNAMDVFCLPSWREGMPRTILEAMSMGKPVVATNIRGCREEVVHEKTGLLVPVRSPELLTDAIERLLKNATLRADFGRAGRVRVLALYDERNVIRNQILKIESYVSESKKSL